MAGGDIAMAARILVIQLSKASAPAIIVKTHILHRYRAPMRGPGIFFYLKKFSYALIGQIFVVFFMDKF